MSGSRVLGIYDVLAEIDKTTSCGYPASLHFTDKNSFLSSDVLPGCVKKPCDILNDYWDVIGGANVDRIVPIWTCSQKVEIRSVDKLRDNKVRTFTAAPIEHTVSLNRLCLDMNNKFYAGFDKSWSFVGSTKYLSGWDRLYNRLNKHPHAFELDESDWDASCSPFALFGQRDIRYSMLAAQYRTEENWKRLDAVYQSIVHSVVVMEKGDLVQKHIGNPSGCGNTISDNTMILYRLFAYAWIILCKQLNKLDMMTRGCFERECEAALNGDDNTYTCSDRVVDWFNPKNIKVIWTSVGVATKTPCESPRKLSEVSFLSQGFRYDESIGLWVPVPETEKVLSSMMYGARISDVRFDLLRAHALRLESYCNPYCRQVLSGYIEWLNNHYHDDFYGEVTVKGQKIPMKDILNLWKSDMWIEALYAGREKLHSETLKILDAVLN